MNAQTGIINIRGKEYQTVALRVQLFRQAHPDHSLTTAVVSRDPDCVVMQATIGDPSGRIIATGHAEEYRTSSQINKTSALENAETSAIGRALAAFGIGGTEFASANEVANAIHQQGKAADAGRSKESEVSPPAAERHDARKDPWSKFYSGRSALHKGLVVHQAELNRIGTEGVFDDLEAYLTSPEYADFVKVAGEHMPHYLEGGHPAPEEFVGIFALEQRARDMIAMRGNVPATEPA